MRYEHRDTHRPIIRLSSIFLLILAAAVACGATGNRQKQTASSSSDAPLEPLSYDPRVSLAPLVERVGPAVVNIQTSVQMRSPRMPPHSLFDYFFGPRNRESLRPHQLPDNARKSMGSGFIIDSNGYVVTNHHVVAKADDIEVMLADERTFAATVAGSDERTDLALLKLENATDLPVVHFGDSSELKVGDHVVAIGNPFGLDHTVTSGIVSAKERVIGAGPYDDFIQTDASINPGNSGGPLFNLSGEVVGINTAITRTGQGIGFAIPSDLARTLIDSIRTQGKVVRGWLGIGFQPVDDALADALGIDDTTGALVATVNDGSPADKGGLRPRDVLVAINGKPLKSARELPARVASLKPGTKVSFEVIRDGKKKTLVVEIGTMDMEADQASDPSLSDDTDDRVSLGIQVRPLDARLRAQLGARDIDGGLVVTRIAKDSFAAGVLRPGDIITELNTQSIRTIQDFQNAVASMKSDTRVLVRVFRKGGWRYLVINMK